MGLIFEQTKAQLFCRTNFCDWRRMKDFAGLIFEVDKKWKFLSIEMKSFLLKLTEKDPLDQHIKSCQLPTES